MIIVIPERRSSRKLSREDVAIIKKMLREGVLQHQIAAIFETNAGRISEINTGKRFRDVPAAP